LFCSAALKDDPDKAQAAKDLRNRRRSGRGVGGSIERFIAGYFFVFTNMDRNACGAEG
jgi:hypothetical protein